MILTDEEILQLVTTGVVNLTDDLIMRMAESYALHSEWQIAFAEWHRHRTDECAEAEKNARVSYLSLIREMRKAKIKSRRV